MTALFTLIKERTMQNPKDDVLYAPVEWVDHSEGYTDIRFHKSTDGIAKITINRPEVRNAFRPQTVKEMIHAFSNARFDEKIGVIVLTGEGEKHSVLVVTKKFVVTTAVTKMKAVYIT